jgi:hypothetical protein
VIVFAGVFLVDQVPIGVRFLSFDCMLSSACIGSTHNGMIIAHCFVFVGGRGGCGGGGSGVVWM